MNIKFSGTGYLATYTNTWAGKTYSNGWLEGENLDGFMMLAATEGGSAAESYSKPSFTKMELKTIGDTGNIIKFDFYMNPVGSRWNTASMTG